MSRVWCAASGWEREGEFACVELAINLHYYYYNPGQPTTAQQRPGRPLPRK